MSPFSRKYTNFQLIRKVMNIHINNGAYYTCYKKSYLEKNGYALSPQVSSLLLLDKLALWALSASFFY